MSPQEWKLGKEYSGRTEQSVHLLIHYYFVQALAADLPRNNNLCLLASAINNLPPLPLDKGDDDASGKFMMMRGMTAKNFDPERYAGRWFEVASLKRGFAGQGQEDCHCTQVDNKGIIIF